MLSVWAWLAGSRAGRIVAGVAAVLAAFLLVYQRGRGDARRDVENDAMKGVLDDLENVRRARRESDDPERLRDDDGYRRP